MQGKDASSFTVGQYSGRNIRSNLPAANKTPGNKLIPHLLESSSAKLQGI